MEGQCEKCYVCLSFWLVVEDSSFSVMIKKRKNVAGLLSVSERDRVQVQMLLPYYKTVSLDQALRLEKMHVTHVTNITQPMV